MKNTNVFRAGIVAAALAVCAAVSFADEDKTKSPAKVIDQAADGSVTLLAKDATTHGTTIRYEPQPHKNTIGYWTKAEDWVSWNFKLHTPGNFTVELTQACGKGSGGSEYNVTVGNQTLADKVPDTGAFTNFVNRRIGKMKLDQPGNYTVSVKALTKPGLAVMDLRAIKLIPNAASVQSIIARDIADGINSEVRAKEAALHLLANGLRPGLTVPEALQMLGVPHTVKVLKVEPHLRSTSRTNSIESIPLGTGASLGYWPRVGVPFDGRNGQGYNVLNLDFDTDHQLVRWFWEPPVIVMAGSLGSLKKLSDYWYGKHEVSGPPP